MARYGADKPAFDGDLLNRPIDIVIDCLILVLVASSIVPQVIKLLRSGDLSGISTWYLLFNAFSTTFHFVCTLIYHGYSYPRESDDLNVIALIRQHKLQGPAAFGALLGLIQVFVHWCGCMIM